VVARDRPPALRRADRARAGAEWRLGGRADPLQCPRHADQRGDGARARAGLRQRHVIEVLKQVVAAAYASLGDAGIVLGAEGNASVADRSSGIALVTGTGLHARESTADGIAEVGLADGAHRSGPEPTSELPSHLALLRAGHGAVVHTHAPHATAVGLVRDEVPLVMAEQAVRAGGGAPVVPYVT